MPIQKATQTKENTKQRAIAMRIDPYSWHFKGVPLKVIRIKVFPKRQWDLNVNNVDGKETYFPKKKHYRAKSGAEVTLLLISVTNDENN